MVTRISFLMPGRPGVTIPEAERACAGLIGAAMTLATDGQPLNPLRALIGEGISGRVVDCVVVEGSTNLWITIESL